VVDYLSVGSPMGPEKSNAADNPPDFIGAGLYLIEGLNLSEVRAATITSLPAAPN